MKVKTVSSVNFSADPLKSVAKKLGVLQHEPLRSTVTQVVRKLFPEESPSNIIVFFSSQNMWIDFSTVAKHAQSSRPSQFLLLEKNTEDQNIRCMLSPPFQLRNMIETRAHVFLRKEDAFFFFPESIVVYSNLWFTYNERVVARSLNVAVMKKEVERADSSTLNLARSCLKAQGLRIGNIAFRVSNFILFKGPRPVLEFTEDDSMPLPEMTGDSSDVSETPEVSEASTPLPDVYHEEKEEEDDRLRLDVNRGDSAWTSVSCLAKMYDDDRSPYPFGAMCGIIMQTHRNKYLIGEDGKRVPGKDNRWVVEKSAYQFARDDVAERRCAMFSFDSGMTSDDPKEQKKLAFAKKYFTGSFESLWQVFLRGHVELLRHDRDMDTFENIGLNRCCYESLAFWLRSKFFIDSEMYLSFNNCGLERVDRMMEILLAFVIEMAKTLCGVSIHLSDFLVLSSDKGDKISRHIICLNPAFAFRTMLAMDWFYLMCFEELEQRLEDGNKDVELLRIKDKNGIGLWFWDGCTTKEFQLFRVYGGDKFGANRPLTYKPELNFAELGGYAQEWKEMKPRERFLNSLIQYPWKGSADEDYGIDFDIHPNANIGRFRCVFEDGTLVGFETITRKKTKGRVLRSKKLLSPKTGGVPGSVIEAVVDWLKKQVVMRPWLGYAMETARFKFAAGKTGKRSIMIEFKGDGQNEVFCLRRDRICDEERAKHNAADDLADELMGRVPKRAKIMKPTHSGAPVLIWLEYNNFYKKWCIRQTCNKPECEKIHLKPLGDIPPEIVDLIEEN